MHKLADCGDDRTADNLSALHHTIDRRWLPGSAGKPLGLMAGCGLVGILSERSSAAGKVTNMGFDHPYNFVTYVSDIQRWGTVYAKEHGLRAAYTSDNGKLDAQIANLET